MSASRFSIGRAYCTKNLGVLTNALLYETLYKHKNLSAKKSIDHEKSRALVVLQGGKEEMIGAYIRSIRSPPPVRYEAIRSSHKAHYYSRVGTLLVDKQTPALFLGYESIPFHSSHTVDINDAQAVEEMKASGNKFFLAFIKKYALAGRNQTQLQKEEFYVVDNDVRYPTFLINGIKCVVLDGSKSNFEKIDVSAERPQSTTLTFEITLSTKPGLLDAECKKQIAKATKQLTQMPLINKYGFNVSFKEAKNELKQTYEAFDYAI